MAISDYAGTKLTLPTVPNLATLPIFNKLVVLIPVFVKWKKNEEISTMKGDRVSQDEGKVAEINKLCRRVGSSA
ncbi:hypothetical protein PMIN01_13172 [Paraphaeosphaeria minitans]|uniref:Uncharacterized protein n=1 Tax=Paraphaeosphaeria minitans TaxID=565426 RepID=A0A9P6G479_9PLEO|nr:hypothetical protein PMIN01_13172 [Paraphaeosphaeria minitans]